VYLAYDFAASAHAEYNLFLKRVGIDGGFCDFSGTLHKLVAGVHFG
jgi:hypothetical protein